MLIKYSGKYVKIYFNMKITFYIESSCDVFMRICSYLTYYVYGFYRENGGWGWGG